MTDEQQELLKQIRERHWMRPKHGTEIYVDAVTDVTLLLSLVDSQVAVRQDHYFRPTLVRDSCAKCGKGAIEHPGHDQVAASTRSACIEAIRALRPAATGAGAFKDAAIKALESVTIQEQK